MLHFNHYATLAHVHVALPIILSIQNKTMQHALGYSNECPMEGQLLCGCFAGYIIYPPALLSSVPKLINPPLKDLTRGQMKAAVRKVKG